MIFSESMSIGEKLLSALSITILGMLVVFAVLVILSYSLGLLRIIFGDKTKAAPAQKSEDLNTKQEDDTEEYEVQSKDDDAELVVLITAAIAEFEGTHNNNIIVKTIRELPQKRSIWASAGRQQLMTANNIAKIRR